MPVRPVGRIHDRFLDQVKAAKRNATVLDLATTAGAQREWALLSRGNWNGDTLDIPDTTKAFDRDVINQDYELMMSDAQNPGSLGSCISLKMQVDWLAALERAFRTRHATIVRSSVHAIARRRGHGSAEGVFLGGVLRYAQDTLHKGNL